MLLVAFSCKGRGVCPSCTTKRMVATAAHLVDAVIPRVPMRQWVSSPPKRLRPALRSDPTLATQVLRILIESIERVLRGCCAAPADARPGAVSFLPRFGSALNEHWHYHCCVSDGVFATADDGSLRFVFATIDGDAATPVGNLPKQQSGVPGVRKSAARDGAVLYSQTERGFGFPILQRRLQRFRPAAHG